MSTLMKHERRGAPRLFDWLESELPFFAGMRWPDQGHVMRCEEYLEEDRLVVMLSEGPAPGTRVRVQRAE